MANVFTQFARDMFDKSGYVLNVPLGGQLKLGDILVLEKWKLRKQTGRLFKTIGNVSELGIQVETEEDETAGDIITARKKSYSYSMIIKGEVSEGSRVPKGKAGIEIKFSGKSGYLFLPAGVHYHRVKGLLGLRSQLKDRLDSGTFNLMNSDRVFVVTHLAAIDSYAYLESASANAEISFFAEGDTNFLQLEDLAKAELGLKISHNREMAYHDVGKAGGNLFFSGLRCELADGVVTFALKRDFNLETLPGETGAHAFNLGAISSEDVEEMYPLED